MESVFLNLLNMSITAGWIVLAVAALRLLLRKAPKAFLIVLWALVGVRLILPVSIESVLSLIPSAETVPQSIMTAYTPKISSGFSAVDGIINPILPRGGSSALPGSAQASVLPEAGISVSPMAVITKTAAAIWLIGMVVLFLYAAVSFLRLKKRIEESVRLSENIYLCDRISSPFVLGLFRPKIFLPSDLPEQDRTFVIAHERAHIRRHDQIFKPLGFLLLAVYWFNPLMWIGYILFCRDIEFACDERVLLEMGTEVKKPYSTALIECSVPRRIISACPLAFGEANVKNRVRSVLNYRKPKFWIIIGTAAACIAVGVLFLTNPVKASPSQESSGQDRMMPASEPEPEPEPDPAAEWVEPDRHAGSFDYSDPSEGNRRSVIHIDYEVPEEYEVTFPMLWMTYDNPRFGERMNNPPTDNEILKQPREIEVLKDGKLVFSMGFVSKPRYYEVTMPVFYAVNTPRQELLDKYYADFEQFEREDGTFLTAREVDVFNGEEKVRGTFGGIDLSGSKKLAVMIYAPDSVTPQELKEYAGWFKFGPIQDTDREVSGFLRRMDDPLPVFGRETLENEAGSVLASYYTFDGFDISCPRNEDPAAENDLEIRKDGDLVYAARIISKEEMQSLKSQYEADPGMEPTDVFATNNYRLKSVGKQEYDYIVTDEDHHYFSLIDFLGSDTAAMLIESYTTADGSWENSFFPYFTYTLLPYEEGLTADYTVSFEDAVLNVAFISQDGYRVSNPAEEMTPEESEERAERLDPPATREVYAGDECVFRFYFTGTAASSMQGLPTFYEQKLARAQADGTLYEQGEKDLYEYFFYERNDPRDEGAITYAYMGSFKEYPTYGFTVYSPVSREEAEKQFEAMKLWFTQPQA